MVSLKKPLTYLGTLFPGIYDDSGNYKDGKLINPPSNAKELFGQYESVITQATYFSRLAYEPNEVIARASQFVHYNPVVFNTALSLIRYNHSRFLNKGGKISIETPIRPENKDTLFLNSIDTLHDTPCYIQYLDYSNTQTNVPFPGKKVLYITFRGTITVGGGLADANITSRVLSDILKNCSMKGKSGLDIFKDEIDIGNQESKGINPFGAHRGFVGQMLKIMATVCKALESKFLKLPIDKIIVTGHSLGAANATLASLVLGGFKRAGILETPIHCITFGGPKLFTDYTRNVYNGLLMDGHLTLDRVTNRGSALKSMFIGAITGATVDLVPLIPPNFVHPGFMILKLEHHTQTRTGRSKNIGDLRIMFTGDKLEPTFNRIATYSQYTNCFDPLLKDKYSEIINVTGTLGRWRTKYITEYNLIKGLVDKLLGFQSNEQTSEPVATNPAEVTGVDPKEVSLTVANDSESEITQGPTNQNITKGGFSLRGKHSAAYAEDTMKYGPNHIVYSPQMVVSPVSAHLTYCGVGWNGVLKNFQYVRKACEEIQYGGIPIENPFCISEAPATETTPLLAKGGKRGRTYKKTKRHSRTRKFRSR